MDVLTLVWGVKKQIIMVQLEYTRTLHGRKARNLYCMIGPTGGGLIAVGCTTTGGTELSKHQLTHFFGRTGKHVQLQRKYAPYFGFVLQYVWQGIFNHIRRSPLLSCRLYHIHIVAWSVCAPLRNSFPLYVSGRQCAYLTRVWERNAWLCWYRILGVVGAREILMFFTDADTH